MVAVAADKSWERELHEWFAPFCEALGNKKRRKWAPVYLKGLLGPGERKSIEPMADRLAPGDQDQLNHFVNQSPWDAAPLARLLVAKANDRVGGADSLLIIDDTALVKKGKMSVGVAHQYCGELGKKANCQSLVSLTLAREDVPVMVGLELFLPKVWIEDAERRAKCGVPEAVVFREKWRIALEKLDRVMEAGAEFGWVTSDVAYGVASQFRQGLIDRGLRYAVGILPTQIVYPADVKVTMTKGPGRGRPRKHPVPSVEGRSAEAFIAALPKNRWRAVRWRNGTKGPLSARFCAVRVRMGEGRKIAKGKRLPADLEQWLVCEERKNGERRYFLSNAPADAPRIELVRAIKGRWSCEQAHQQMKQELGLDHFEGRSWRGLHHHALLSMIAFCFLQYLRLKTTRKPAAKKGGKNHRVEKGKKAVGQTPRGSSS